MAQDLNLCLLGGNNLGGKGPDWGAQQAVIRYKNVAQQGMTAVDLVVENQGYYEPQDPGQNGNSGEGKQIGDISIKAKSKVHLMFKFVKTGSMEPVALDFYFTLYLTSIGERLGLRGSLPGFQKYCLSEGSVLKAELPEDAQGAEFVPSSTAHPLKPRDPYTLDQSEKDQAVTLFFHSSEFPVAVDFTGSEEGFPSFMFSGTAPLQDHCTPWDGGSHLAPNARMIALITTTGTTTTVSTSTATTSTATTSTQTTRTQTTSTASTTTATTSTKTGTTMTATTATATTTTNTLTATETTSTRTTMTETSSTSTHTTSTWDICGPVTPEPPRLYDCESGSESEWSWEKKDWCHQEEVAAAATTTPDPFNCHEGYHDWQHLWSYEKRSFCCQRCDRGCTLLPTTSTTTKAPYDCGPADASPLTELDVAQWSQDKVDWCCIHSARGCATTPDGGQRLPANGRAPGAVQPVAQRQPLQPPQPPTQVPAIAPVQPTQPQSPSQRPGEQYQCSGLATAWDWRRKAWCCAHHSVGCQLGPEFSTNQYDCKAGIRNWRMGWSLPKQRWCCHTAHLGCTEVTTTSSSFNCEEGFLQWQSAWSDPKKRWCCEQYGRGCRAGVIFDCSQDFTPGWEARWSYRKREWCCTNKNIGCAPTVTSVEPFDCVAGYSTWRVAWTPGKRQYCCSQYNRGCEQITQRRFEELRAGALQFWQATQVLSGGALFILMGCLAAVLAVAALVSRTRRRASRVEAEPMLAME